MGFYAPAQFIQDARRHGAEIYPVDVNQSAWECTLESVGSAPPQIKLGLSTVSGLAGAVGKSIALARRDGEFRRIGELARRVTLDRRAVKCLAAAGAFATLAGNRHQSYWVALGIEEPWTLGDVPRVEAQPMLAVPSEGQDVVADYASIGLSQGRHPLSMLREQLTSAG